VGTKMTLHRPISANITQTNMYKNLSALPTGMLCSIYVLLSVVLPQIHAATLWTGPSIVWSKSPTTPSDTVLVGKVVLTRGNAGVLFNTADGESAPGTDSPKGTEWAFGNLTNYQTLHYQSLNSMRNGDLAALILNKPMVMHIIAEDIYVSVKFTAWGQNGAGTVSYTRSTPATSTPPSVVITSPVEGAVFAAPADVKLAAMATASGATVTNVSFFENTKLLGNLPTAPFSLTASNLPAGAYMLTAVATAGGVLATSAPVNVSIVAPIAVSLSRANVSNNLVSFNYSADPGLVYVVESSLDLIDWSSVLTNVAVANLVPFSQLATNALGFYRVGRLPNP
jgi:hypothetical protein